jgi:phage pi2 protein 07
MKFNDFIVSEEKVRLDPKCWTGKKIGNPKTKVKGGVRVNNCVPAESVEEGFDSTYSPSTSSTNSTPELRGIHIPGNMKHPDWREPTWSFQEIAEKLGITSNELRTLVLHIGNFPKKLEGVTSNNGSKTYYPRSEVKRWVNATDIRNIIKSKQSVAEAANPAQQAAIAIAKKKKAGVDEAAPPGAKAERMVKHIKKGYAKDGKLSDKEKSIAYATAWKAHNKGVTESSQRVDSLVTDALKIMQGSEASDAVAALKTVLGDREYNSRRGYYNFYVRQLMDMSGQQGMAEDYNPEYDDEAGMVENNLETLDRAVDGLDDLINSGDNLPEWCQEKIAVAKSMLVSVWDYMYSEEASDEVDPEVDEMFEAMDQLAEEMARKKGVSVDLVWETFEAMDDHMLYETAAWRRKEGKSAKGGLNAKGVASYRRENPGSKLQTAVTTKPSKLKPGSKAAKRRKSFCARMGGVKGPMKKPNGKPTRKALALRKWNC